MEVSRPCFGPGLWPGPRRQARWAGRSPGSRSAAGASCAAGCGASLGWRASPDNARRSGPVAVTFSCDRRTGATLGALTWARSEGLEPPTFRSVARFRSSRSVCSCQTDLLRGLERGRLVQPHPALSNAVVSKSVSKIGSRLPSRIVRSSRRLDANYWRRRRLSSRTVLALPQVRVSARWMSCWYTASIEMQVTGVAGHRSSPEVFRCTHRMTTPVPRDLSS